MRIDLLRHGEYEDEAYLRGRTDAPLSPRGMGQMRRRLIRRRYRAVFTSPLQRCRAFAEQWAEGHNLPLTVLDELAERDWGAWDGLPLETVRARWPEELAAYLDDPFAVTPPDAEPLPAFRERVLRGLQQVAASGCDPVLVVTHGGVMKLVAQQVLAFPDTRLFNFAVEPACLMGVAVIGSFLRLEQLEND